MSKYRDAIKKHGTPGVPEEAFSPAARELCPEATAIFLGEKNAKGQWDPSPSTISLFVGESGRLTACVKPKHDALIAFTTITAADRILEALEEHFCKTDLDWKVPTKKK